jgi:hypothetical protein
LAKAVYGYAVRALGEIEDGYNGELNGTELNSGGAAVVAAVGLKTWLSCFTITGC